MDDFLAFLAENFNSTTRVIAKCHVLSQINSPLCEM